MSVSGDAHQQAVVTLTNRLQYWISEGTIDNAPSRIAFNDGTSASPDIFWVGERNQKCLNRGEGLWQGSPDLVIEVVAVDTEAADRGKKFNLYQDNQIFEYWIVNPIAQFIEVYVSLNRRYQRTGLYEAGESFSSGVLNGRVFEVNDLLGISK